LVVALVLANAVLFRHGIEKLSADLGWVVHTLQVQSAIHQVEADVVLFNRSVRQNWVAPEHPPIDSSLSTNLMRDAGQIERLTIDNFSQQRHFVELKTLLEAHVARRPVISIQPGNVALSGQIDGNTQKIMVLLGAMNAEEEVLLQQRQGRIAATMQQINAGLAAETAAQLLFVGLFFLYYVRSKERSEVVEAARREVQANLASVLECTSDCVMTIGNDWSLVYGNRQTLESLRDFKVGEDYWTCFPAVAGTQAEQYLRSAMSDRKPGKFENFYGPYGRWYRVEIFPTDIGLNVFFGDITDEKQMLDELEIAQRHSEDRIEELSRMTVELARVNELLNSVMDSASDGIIKISRSWRIIYGNRAAIASLADFRVDDDFWRCFPALLSTHAEERLRTAMDERVETGYDIFYTPYSGWYRIRIFPTVRGISLFFSNITAEKKLQEQLEQEQLLREKRIEALSHMAGGLAHEISNPLAIIHGLATELLEMAAGEAPLAACDVRGACSVILKTSNRASGILRGLRGFAREASKDEMQLASIYDISDENVDLQQSRFDRHHVELRVKLDADLPLLLCRQVQIGQILTNLLNNAFDAIVQSESLARWVEMTAMSDGETMVIEVTDSGPGIEDHFKSRLMEAFFTTKEFGLGMGVGLSLSRAIAQDHGGTLTLCIGRKNTCFQLVLPLVQGTPEMIAEPALLGVPY
jgi:C4-dicarboxylate-specific signal transduction histidine kinase